MIPKTLEIMTALSVEEINGELKKLIIGADIKEIDPATFLDFATNCRNIADVAEALENIYMTAADELYEN